MKTQNFMHIKSIIIMFTFMCLIGCNQSSKDKEQSVTIIPSQPGLSLGIASVPNLRDLGGYETDDGSIENYFSEGLGIDAAQQMALRDLHLAQ